MRILFQLLGAVGFIIICVCAFTIPNNPYEIIPAMTIYSFDKPLWLCIIVGGGFLWLMILLGVYDKMIGLDD